jgi:cytochrome c peroxidase
MRLIPYLAIFTIVAGAAAMAHGDLRERAKQIFRPLPATPPSIADNPASTAKAELGKLLFFDPRLSKSGKISCNSCHDLKAGGADNRPVSIGHGGQHGRRNAPTVLNSVFNIAQFWDGRERDLKSQAKHPVQTSFEMNNTSERVEQTLKSIPEYVQRFTEAFPGDDHPVNFDNVLRSIEIFEATLITPNAPFDRFLRGDDHAMTEKQRRGLDRFIFHGCATCHRGVNVGGNAFFQFGMRNAPGETLRPPEDHGLGQVTGRVRDQFFFRVAPLRNVALTAPYFHSGRVWDLDEAVRIMAKSQLDIATLPDQDVEDIVAFLHALTGEQPQIIHPVLPPIANSAPGSGTPESSESSKSEPAITTGDKRQGYAMP